jgi:hypothetical protein
MALGKGVEKHTRSGRHFEAGDGHLPFGIILVKPWLVNSEG